jgi:hypothetical protein
LPVNRALYFFEVSVVDLIREELLRVREQLKFKTESELRELNLHQIRIEYDVFGKKYPLSVYSEEDPDGSIVTIIEISKKQFLGSYICYQEGFRYKNGEFINMTEDQLWEYD